jgi:hypothetical protein
MRIREAQNIRILIIRIRTGNTGTFTSFFKDQNSCRSHNTVEIKVFPAIFALMMEGSGPGRPKNHTDLDPDADPETKHGVKRKPSLFFFTHLLV